MKIKAFSLLLCLCLLFVGCEPKNKPPVGGEGPADNPAPPSDLGGDDKSFGDTLDALYAYDGYFEGEATDITIQCLSGTDGAYRIEGSTLTFTAITEKTAYAISGRWRGNIVIDVGDDYKFTLALCGFSQVCAQESPLTVLSGDKVTIEAQAGCENYIYDKREAIDEADAGKTAGAVHAETDLAISGAGGLVVVSENNNGIHTKDDLQVKELTLLVACVDNALKGNDSVEITGGNTVLIASGGDGIKTTRSDISDKGKQRGTVEISGGTHSVYAATDGIDAAYNVAILGDETVLNIYTDKYSSYSREVTATENAQYYIRFTSDAYAYSVKYYNDEDDYLWVDAVYHSTVKGGFSNYYYYAFPKNTAYEKMQFFIYSEKMAQGQAEEYLGASEYLTPSTAYDTFALTSRGSQLSYGWTNYTTTVNEGGFGGPGGMGRPGGMGGPPGMGEGNKDKGDYSTKGIKAANEVLISSGTVNIKSYDDAIHANADSTLENGATPLGNVTVMGGRITLYSNDDGIHADGAVTVSAGNVRIVNSYEGVEGNTVLFAGGDVSVYAKDDGVNATAQAGTGVTVSDGRLYIYAGGDGIDTNSRASYSGIVFSGGNVLILSTSGGNSAIDTEAGYEYTGGVVLALMPRGGMSGEAKHCRNFTDVGKEDQLSFSEGDYLYAEIGGESVTWKMPVSLSACVVMLGDNAASVLTISSYAGVLNDDGFSWE